MIDHFSILVTHGLLLLAAWRLLARDDLNDEGAVKRGWRKKPLPFRGGVGVGIVEADPDEPPPPPAPPLKGRGARHA